MSDQLEFFGDDQAEQLYLAAVDKLQRLGGEKVKHVIEAGFSQDGGFTFTQANFFHRLERMPGDLLIYDGYVPGGTTGPSNLNFGLTEAGTLPLNDPRHAMQPREAPVIHVNTETEIFLGSLMPVPGLAYRRPDSDDPDDRYRLPIFVDLPVVARQRHIRS